jgi:hypothetical protein
MCIPLVAARQRLGKDVPSSTNTHDNKRIIGRVIFYAVRVLSTARQWVSLFIPLMLLGNNSVNTYPRQRKIVEDVVLYAVHVV